MDGAEGTSAPQGRHFTIRSGKIALYQLMPDNTVTQGNTELLFCTLLNKG